MARIVGVELVELDLPFRQPFRHARARRATSESLFLRCITDDGRSGYGEALPRAYVTGESRARTFDLLSDLVLPRLLDLEFGSFDDVYAFLLRCDGRAPAAWVDPALPQGAAWCLIDLALLDAFARAFGRSLYDEPLPGEPRAAASCWPTGLRYGAVLSSGGRARTLRTLLEVRLFGIRDLKVKVDGDALALVRWARRLLGREGRLRLDANAAWTREDARRWMPALERLGVESFEQPLPAPDLDGMATLVQAGHPVMADESFHDAASLEGLIAARACTAVNVRISKCGGLVASLARSRRALEAGLTLQVGCQVGETSQLSAAQLLLLRALGGGVRYAEGCFGERLLAHDPVRPLLQFGRGGRAPAVPRGLGFGTVVDVGRIHREAGRRFRLGAGLPESESTG